MLSISYTLVKFSNNIYESYEKDIMEDKPGSYCVQNMFNNYDYLHRVYLIEDLVSKRKESFVAFRSFVMLLFAF